MKILKNITKFISIIILCGSLDVSAVMISSVKIAYVDVEEVFNSLIKVQETRRSLGKLMEEKKNQIQETEEAIQAVKNKIELQREQLPPSEVEEFARLLQQKEEDLKELIADSKELISGKEKESKYEILGEIYDMIDEIASREGYTVILEKEAVLFSKESTVDITEDVIARMNKKYE